MHIPEEQASNLIRAVEHYAAYLKATKRDDRLYRELAESLQPKPPAPRREVPQVKRRHTSTPKSRPVRLRR
jgi:hypothetical protein